MIANPRQQRLIDEVKRRGFMSVDGLSQLLEVTAQTIRRDVSALAQAGLLARFHGGVGVPSSTVENIAYSQRQSLNSEGKRRIAEAVARRVPNGCSLILNIGTTTEAIARALRHHEDLRVVTNNLNVAAILSDNPRCEVIVCGGQVRSRDRGIVGEAAVDFIRQFRVDIGLIGISSVESDGTLRDFDYREVKVAQAIIAQSREVWLAADHSKFTRRAMVQLAHLSQVHVLFTDQPLSAQIQACLDESGGQCVLAQEDSTVASGSAGITRDNPGARTDGGGNTQGNAQTSIGKLPGNPPSAQGSGAGGDRLGRASLKTEAK